MKNKNYSNEFIEISDLVKLILKNKLLILFSSLFFSLIGFTISMYEKKTYEVTFHIANPASYIFYRYDNVLGHIKKNSPDNKGNSVSREFFLDFEENLLSVDNLVLFSEQSKNIEDLKGYLKKNKIELAQYFKNNRIIYLKEKNQILLNKYLFKFTKELEGDTFIHDYVLFIRNKTLVEFQNKLNFSILNLISEFDENLQIAYDIKLADPILKSSSQGFQVVNEPDLLFYRGSKVLEQQKKFLNNLLLNINISEFEYNPFVERPAYVNSKDENSKLFALSGLVFGFIFSVVIIFIRKTL